MMLTMITDDGQPERGHTCTSLFCAICLPVVIFTAERDMRSRERPQAGRTRSGTMDRTDPDSTFFRDRP